MIESMMYNYNLNIS